MNLYRIRRSWWNGLAATLALMAAFLPRAAVLWDVDDVVQNVKETLDIMIPCGGDAIAPAHNIQGNTPLENIVARCKTTMTA